MNHFVARRLVAEFTGTGLLVAIVVGSGIAATNLTADAALRLLINSLVTAMGPRDDHYAIAMTDPEGNEFDIN